MDDDDKYNQYANLPIPSYEEATSSRPTSSQNYRGAEEISDDAERQGLLDQDGRRTYRPPTAESARSSVDSDLRLPEVTGDGEYDRRQIEELDYLDPSADPSQRQRSLYHRARLRGQWSKRIAATFSSLRLPSFRSLYTPVATAEPTAPETPPEQLSWSARIRRRIAVPDQYRISAPTFARLCALFTIAASIYLLFALDLFRGNGRHMGSPFDPEAVRQFVQDQANGDSIARYLYHITSFDHVAGTEGDLYLAKWMQEQWVEDGGFDEVALMDYYVYLNYPTMEGRSVSIVAPEEKKWTAQLEEDQVDPTKQQTLAWHGHSKSGNAKGHLIYANGGGREDFKWLNDNGAETNGAIALVRYYATQGDRALKIKAAEEAGCVGVLIYSDPSDDGFGKGNVIPDGPWRPEGSLQRGAVSLMSWVVGDPLTPGWASTIDADRVSKDDNPGLNSIPSLPLAWRDAKVLISALDGQGVQVPKKWVGGNGKKKWFSGAKDGKGVPIVALQNENEENDKQQIWNLHGILTGIEAPEKKVIVGNHRDAWCFGSVDPGSGSAVMMEVVSIFNNLRRKRWRPLRTIEFVSWDAEEYNLVGSTEYVEDNIDYLRRNGIAYLNVDVGVSGQNFRAAASPLFQKALMHVLGRVSDPTSNDTLRNIWGRSESKLEGLGAGSDYVAFQDMAGTSSIDFGFEGEPFGFPYHSCYETFQWMEQFGDPGFNYHRTLAQVWALLILEIADRPVIPFDLKVYADAIHLYIKQLQQDAEETYGRLNAGNTGKALNPKLLKQSTSGFDLSPLHVAANKLTRNIRAFHRFEDVWTTNVLGRGGMESPGFAIKRMQYNDRLTNFETDLLDIPTEKGDNGPHGVPGREQFKHVIFGPQAWSGYDEAYFPAIRDAMDVGDWKGAQKMVERAAEVLERAGERLVE